MLKIETTCVKQGFLGVLGDEILFLPTLLLPNVLICTYFNHLISNYNFYSFDFTIPYSLKILVLKSLKLSRLFF
jgi:hypothetical protein